MLIEVVERFDDDDPMVSVGEIDAMGLTEGHVVRAGRHLSRAGYVDAVGSATPSTDCSGRSRNASQRHVPKRRAG